MSCSHVAEQPFTGATESTFQAHRNLETLSVGFPGSDPLAPLLLEHVELLGPRLPHTEVNNKLKALPKLARHE